MSKYIKLYYITPLTTLIIYLIGVWFTFDLKWFYFDVYDDSERAVFTGWVFIKIIVDLSIYINFKPQ